MKLASTLHNSTVRIPFTFDLNLQRASLISCPKNARVQFSLPRSYPLYSGVCDCGRKYYYSKIFCARKTEQEQESSASEGQTSTSPLRDGVFGVDGSENISSISNSGEKDPKTVDYASSLRTVASCVFSAVAFGVGLGFKYGVGKASEFFAGYLLEQSLSVDNLFVFVLIFKYFKVPLPYQNRVLSYGIAGAIIFRLTLIFLGSVTLQRFEAVNLLLAAILLYSSFKLFAEEDEDADLSDNFIVKTCQKFIPVTSNYDGDRFITVQNDVWKATPLLLTVAVIELSDIAFAVDSIPAVFGVTRDPFIVFTSNLFAILGLRSYYTLISESMADLEYLQPAIGGILGFIGCKMILDFFGFHVSTEVSLGFVATSLSAGVLLSLIIKKSD
ncbi:thylakoid membrane protein TERC, chloroplastic isoform X1 [Olea europaea var. sylvestris]|uniref:thylakoid membrane protein TERC, chloroplastic isoform X1 n=1 Tax=Olea europaea var. sylvestris TaxID=158386 RepID=UPI000C1D50F4|nr:thylakoid membrane protein TERC, chloroplastic isoform X1 [Olea europaea var. sylvestris]